MCEIGNTMMENATRQARCGLAPNMLLLRDLQRIQLDKVAFVVIFNRSDVDNFKLEATCPKKETFVDPLHMFFEGFSCSPIYKVEKMTVRGTMVRSEVCLNFTFKLYIKTLHLNFTFKLYI